MMRTKRVVVMGFVLLGLLVGREAQAFYNPSSGRWLSRDPLEEDDNLNIYGFLSNKGFNCVDLLGFATLEFKVVVGTYNPPGNGTWSSPFWAGTGKYRVGSDWVFAYVDLYNGSWWGPWTFHGNYCNTVDWKDPIARDFGDAGSILVVVSDCDGGRFRITGTYKVKVGGEGPGQYSPKGATYARAVLSKGGPGPGKSKLMETAAYKGKPPVVREVPFSIDVELMKGERKVALTHDAILQFPNPEGKEPSFGLVEGQFIGVAVKTVK